jgi:uncharacterized protein YbaR (Trm112 family)
VIADAVLSILRCPKSGESLVASNDSSFLVSKESGNRYPVIAGVPWLFDDPEASIWQWRQNVTLYLANESEQEDEIHKLIKQVPRTSVLTRKRLELLRAAKMHDRRAISSLLHDLTHLTQGAQTPISVARIMSSKLPLTQSLTGYYSNIHRDWGWDGLVDSDRDENMLAAKLVQTVSSKALGSGSAGRLAVLGAGCCRLAYDIHSSMSGLTTVAIDINPFLFAIAKSAMEMQPVTLHEYPLAPKDLACHAVKRKLCAPARVGDGFSFIHADGLKSPLAPGSMDWLVTPWFVDIVSSAAVDTIAAINRCLRPGATWTNFGTLVFRGSDIRDQISSDEFMELLAAGGFEIVESRFDSIPYIASPASSHSRVERVLTLSARKIAEATSQDSRVRKVSPEWSIDTRLPVPLTPAIQSFFESHSTYAQIVSLVDGNRSADDISRIMSEIFGMTQEDARLAFLKIALTVNETEKV